MDAIHLSYSQNKCNAQKSLVFFAIRRVVLLNVSLHDLLYIAWCFITVVVTPPPSYIRRISKGMGISVVSWNSGMFCFLLVPLVLHFCFLTKSISTNPSRIFCSGEIDRGIILMSNYETPNQMLNVLQMGYTSHASWMTLDDRSIWTWHNWT